MHIFMYFLTVQWRYTDIRTDTRLVETCLLESCTAKMCKSLERNFYYDISIKIEESKNIKISISSQKFFSTLIKM